MISYFQIYSKLAFFFKLNILLTIRIYNYVVKNIFKVYLRYILLTDCDIAVVGGLSIHTMVFKVCQLFGSTLFHKFVNTVNGQNK